MKKFLFALLFFPFLICNAQTISGKLLGWDGKPMKKANVLIYTNEPTYPQKILKIIDVEKDGSFSIPFKESFYNNVGFCGADHKTFNAPILVDKNGSVSFNVTLSPNYSNKVENLTLIGDFNDFSFNKNAITMKKISEGVFEAVVKAVADTLSYQILGLAQSGNSVNGPIADCYVLDSGGDYRSIIKTKKGTEVTITVDLNKMTFSNASEKIEFADNNSVTAFYYNLMTSITKFKDKLYSEYDEYIKNGGDKEQFKHDYAKDFNEWKAKADAAADEKQKAYYYWAIANVVSNKLDKEMSALMLKYFTPVHPIWSEKGQYLFHFISLPLLTKEEQLQFSIDLLEKNNDETIKPSFIGTVLGLAKLLNKEDLLKKYYDLCVSKYSNSSMFEGLKSQFDPNRAIQIGKEIPDFNFPSIDDETVRITKQSMMGKIYLIDFWATWCGPCVGEMNSLHNAYEKYKDKGFIIVSFSLDFTLDAVKQFRKDKWHMPWYNIYIDQRKEQTFLKSYEITAIPKPMLVGADGKVLATEESLRGEQLEITLAKYFK